MDQKRATGKVWFQLNWQTGAVTDHSYDRRVLAYREHSQWPRIEQRLRELHADHKLDDEIAQQLNAEGFRTTKQVLFNSNAVWHIRKQLGLEAVIPTGTQPFRFEDGSYSVEGAAQALGVFPGTVYQWLKTGRLEGYQLRKGVPWKISLTSDKIEELQQYLQHARHSKLPTVAMTATAGIA